MSAVHVCTVCFRDAHLHTEAGFWPPRCCSGCDCGVTLLSPVFLEGDNQ